jgi:hypothetical protein
MKINIELPCCVELDAYYSVDSAIKLARQLNKKIKFKELDSGGNWYVVLFYVGSLKEPENKEFLKKIKKSLNI